MNARIEGESVEYCGYDEKGRLLLADGTRYEIAPLDMDPGTFRSRPLWRIAKLSYDEDLWKLDGTSVDELIFPPAMFSALVDLLKAVKPEDRVNTPAPRTTEGDTEILTLLELRDNLKAVTPEDRAKIVAVAWTEHHSRYYEGQAEDLEPESIYVEDGKPLPLPRKVIGKDGQECRLPGEVIEFVTSGSPPSKAYYPVLLRRFHKVVATPTHPPAPLDITNALVWNVSQEIGDKLDIKLKVRPTHAEVFLRYCRDKMTLADMRKKYKWKERTLKKRKAALVDFLRLRYKLTLESFFVDRSVFNSAEKMREEHRARSVRPRSLAEADYSTDDQD